MTKRASLLMALTFVLAFGFAPGIGSQPAAPTASLYNLSWGEYGIVRLLVPFNVPFEGRGNEKHYVIYVPPFTARGDRKGGEAYRAVVTFVRKQLSHYETNRRSKKQTPEGLGFVFKKIIVDNPNPIGTKTFKIDSASFPTEIYAAMAKGTPEEKAAAHLLAILMGFAPATQNSLSQSGPMGSLAGQMFNLKASWIVAAHYRKEHQFMKEREVCAEILQSYKQYQRFDAVRYAKCRLETPPCDSPPLP
jgi:hypothetical protein